ncbi:hypothetical protein scyTo_0013685 [Scyliorhinus torazame]|uniref:Uncharacterized protein n=1 Tax=Scyliorhinus torazame TaxID=75743 RepID=A0A401P2D5_SCYTO|nr:hypothetical protein [Scyliorhinus torazame]
MAPLTLLQVLVISNNYIKEIKSGAFENLQELRELYLGPQAQFQDFQYQALIPLKKIKEAARCLSEDKGMRDRQKR